MAWIESHQALQRHRKTIRAAAQLKVSRPLLIGHLHCLWWWAIDNADPDGNMGQVTDAEIAEAAEWPVKSAASFVEVLHQVGFLDADPEAGWRLHDWYDYAGKLADQRKANADRMRAARASRSQPRDSSRAAHVQRTSGERVPDVPAREDDACGATGEDRRGPDRTQPDRTQPTGPLQQPAGEAREASHVTALSDELQAFHGILHALPGYAPSREFYRKLAKSYVHLDLESEALKMADWLQKPEHAETECSTRFVLDWLKREAEKSPAGRPPAPIDAARQRRGLSQRKHL